MTNKTTHLSHLSLRDNPIVAWHEVPGKAPSNEPSRRVRYDLEGVSGRILTPSEVFRLRYGAVLLSDNAIFA